MSDISLEPGSPDFEIMVAEFEKSIEGFEVKGDERMEQFGAWCLAWQAAKKTYKEFFDNFRAELEKVQQMVNKWETPMPCGHEARFSVDDPERGLVCGLCTTDAVLNDVIRLGEQQAAEWDRFWEAMGCKSADITVDQAIEKYKALVDDLQSETAWAKHYSDRANELFAALAVSQSLLNQVHEGEPLHLDELAHRLQANGELLEKQP